MEDSQQEKAELRREIEDLLRQKADLEAKTKTALSPVSFIVILVFVPICWAFVGLGILIVWKTTSNPAEVAPHLDIILVAFAIFSGPVVAGVKDLTTMLGAERAANKKAEAEEDA